MQCFSSSPEVLRLNPEASFTLVSGALNEVSMTYRPDHTGKQELYVHVVGIHVIIVKRDEYIYFDNNKMLNSINWLVHTSCKPILRILLSPNPLISPLQLVKEATRYFINCIIIIFVNFNSLTENFVHESIPLQKDFPIKNKQTQSVTVQGAKDGGEPQRESFYCSQVSPQRVCARKDRDIRVH